MDDEGLPWLLRSEAIGELFTDIDEGAFHDHDFHGANETEVAHPDLAANEEGDHVPEVALPDVPAVDDPPPPVAAPLDDAVPPAAEAEAPPQRRRAARGGNLAAAATWYGEGGRISFYSSKDSFKAVCLDRNHGPVLLFLGVFFLAFWVSRFFLGVCHQIPCSFWFSLVKILLVFLCPMSVLVGVQDG